MEYLKYSGIIKEDIVNSLNGINCTIFFQGCSQHCKGCFNEACWDFSSGKILDNYKQDLFIKLCNEDYIDGVSILGGEPFDQNLKLLSEFISKLRVNLNDNKKIYIWSGYTYEQLKKLNNPFIDNILIKADYLIDGKFNEDLKCEIPLRGSSNQRVIDLKTTNELFNGFPVELEL